MNIFIPIPYFFCNFTSISQLKTLETGNNSLSTDISEVLHVYLHEDAFEYDYASGSIAGQIEWNKSHKIHRGFWDKKGINTSTLSHLEVHICHQHFLLIPQKYDHPLYRIGFLEKALGEDILQGKEIHAAEIPSELANLLFLVPSEWKDALSFWFPLAKIAYHHPLEELIKRSQDNGLSISIFKNQACIVLRKNRQLTLANVFSFKSATELAFYIHSIRDSFFIKWTSDSVFWLSQLDPELEEELISYKIFTPSPSHET
ncbi:DUF3822 family protein [Aquirufa rosea]|uniref:DUF3822 family protein n=1 Tax=Aquirufa rosea TaxID=2509241 RepID=A0A4Q1C1Z6_9BACT|nr:DUF3822 family protein [Aquirufa rosea]RXK52091.1 DUF3822 family protein [Aquirufa rosea]